MNNFENFFCIQGKIEVPAGVDFDTFCDKFQEAMKVLGWRFAGLFEDTRTYEYKEAGNES